MKWLAWLALCGLAACGGETPTPGCEPDLIFLDRGGGRYTHGAHDDASRRESVLVDAPIVLPPWPHDDTDWRSLVDCLTTALAPFPTIGLTEVDPTRTPHVSLVFTTTSWTGPAGTTSFVPDSCEPGHQIEFIFGDALPTYARACHVALFGLAQMRAELSLGDDCRDFVNDELDCAPQRTFLDQGVSCVDAASEPTPCRCGSGETTENTYRAMVAAFPACP